MVYTIKLTPEASIDIKDAIEYYNLQKKNLGQQLFYYIDQAILNLQVNPFLFQKGYMDVRKCPTTKFNSPFIISSKKIPSSLWLHYIVLVIRRFGKAGLRLKTNSRIRL
jgi:hypothetical protein